MGKIMLHFDPSQNIATSKASYLINTVNTKGTMGKGVALAIKERFPKIMEPYQRACREKRLEPGILHSVRVSDEHTVVNMVTKRDWRDNSQYDWIGAGLVYLNRYMMSNDRLPADMCMPMPGCGNGGLDPQQVQQMIRIYMHRSVEAGLDLRIVADEMPAIERPQFYAGIGARDTPAPVLKLMSEVGGLMAEAGIGLRSGGAIGADTAFWDGAKEVDRRNTEIFLPKLRADLPDGILHLSPVFTRMALNFHPNPDAIRPDPNNPNDKRHSTLKLMSRNGNQIFGVDFRNPSNGVICWTKGGKGERGTGQAIRLATSVGIPVIDLGRPELAGISAREVTDMALTQIREFRKTCGLPIAEPGPIHVPVPAGF